MKDEKNTATGTHRPLGKVTNTKAGLKDGTSEVHDCEAYSPDRAPKTQYPLRGGYRYF